MILTTRTSNQTRQGGHTLSTCTVLTEALGTLLFSKLSGLAATGPVCLCVCVCVCVYLLNCT